MKIVVLLRVFAAFLLVLCWLSCSGQAEIRIISWNLRDFGSSKDVNEIKLIAETAKVYDIFAIQEVVAGNGGAQAVARLVDALNRTGFSYDYSISDPTSGNSKHKTEKYAFIWKKSRIKLIGKCWLEKKFGQLIEREPYYAKFHCAGGEFTLANYHAITKRAQPEREVKYFKFLPAQYASDNLLFCGDFNLPQSHSVFNPLKKMGYKPVLIGQKTSLREHCVSGDCLASEFDNFFYNSDRIIMIHASVIHFYRQFTDLKTANSISDHIPVIFVFKFASSQ